MNKKYIAILQQAIHHHQNGRLQQAEQVYREILKINPVNPDVNHLLGVLAHQNGDNKLAAQLIKKAIQENKNQPSYHSNLGIVLGKLNRLEDAEASCRRALKLDSNFIEALNNLGNILQKREEPKKAIDVYQRILLLNNSDPEVHNNLGVAWQKLGKLNEAENSYKKAISLNKNYSDAYSNLGSTLELKGSLEEAKEACKQALRLDPSNAKAHNNLGDIFYKMGRYQRANKSFDKATRIDPGYIEAHYNQGKAYEEAGELDKSEKSYLEVLCLNPEHVDTLCNIGNVYLRKGKLEQAKKSYKAAINLKPDLIEANACLGVLFEMSNELHAAQQYADKALAIDSSHPAANRLAATLLRRSGETDKALVRLSNIPVPADNRRLATDIHFELGLIYDRLKNSEECFKHFTSANTLHRNDLEAVKFDKNRFLKLIRQIDEVVFSEATQTQTCGNERGDYHPVFLIGFPRSGTTLLDQILDSHSQVCVIEEKPILDTVINIINNEFQGGYPSSLSRLTKQNLEDLRSQYINTLKEYCERQPNKTIIDKLPLNIIHVGLIYRLFPHAKFILSLRHPYDVCLSNFMQHYVLNDAMVNFFSIEEAAFFYDKVMKLWQHYLDVLPLNSHSVKYESIVENFDDEVNQLLQFLDIDWEDAVLDFAGHAMTRVHITTPSYQQVTEPIYTRSKYRWQRYAQYFESVASMLGHHVEYYGYDRTK